MDTAEARFVARAAEQRHIAAAAVDRAARSLHLEYARLLERRAAECRLLREIAG